MKDSGTEREISNSTALGEARPLFKYAFEVSKTLPIYFCKILAIFELFFRSVFSKVCATENCFERY